MASLIKARGLKGRALAPLIGRLRQRLQKNTTASGRTKPYTLVIYITGELNINRALPTLELAPPLFSSRCNGSYVPRFQYLGGIRAR
ncbi:hypothetical protein BN1044_01575 [Hafnia alvei]|uniref:Uncharacterized protein n=1 Tax=Hafnia alvei TaxID=569 RepID=A0A1C6YZ32_HAFAL|nr:hypothetical protein BN1044_01575 [Hafnia alvei]